MKRKFVFPLVWLIGCFIMVAAIALINNIIIDEKPNETLPEWNEIIELSVWTNAPETKMRRMKENVERTYSDVRFNIVSKSDLQEALNTGDILPDLVYLSEPGIIEDLQEDKYLLISEDAVPAALYYNKDLFDLFGVSYPEEGVTWEELLPLVERLTRFEYEKQYLGFAASTRILYLYSSPPPPLPNWKRNDGEEIVIEEKWKDWVLFMKALFDAGYNDFAAVSLNRSQEMFTRERTLAMWAGDNILHDLSNHMDEFWHWDLVPFPREQTETELNSSLQAPLFLIPQNGPNKTEALLILSQLLQEGVKTSVSLQEVAEKLKGKNIAALFKNGFDKWSDEEYRANIRLINAFTDTITGKSDINTALRIALEREEKSRLP